MQVLSTFGFTDDPDVPRTLRRALASDPAMGPFDAIYALGRETIGPSSEVAGMRL